MVPRWFHIMRLKFLPRLFRVDSREGVKRYLRALLYLFNLHSLLLGVFACIGVYLCDHFRFSYNMDITLVSTGITFPLIFNIGQAFTRRERALSLIANLKASAVSLYFMHRDWAQDDGFPASLGNDHSAAALHCKLLLMDLLKDVRKYLIAHSPYESYAEQRLAAKHNPYVNMIFADMSLSGASQLSFQAAVDASQKQDPAAAALRRCYRGFSRLSVLNERLGLRSGYTKGGEGGMSRTNQYLRYMIQNLEELRMIREYRTPIMMRYANGVLIHIFALGLAPYFVHFCDSWQSLGWSRSSCPAGYSAAVVFTIICMLLYNVQQDIEQPFDMDGLDDVFFDLGDEVMADVMSPTVGVTAFPSGFTTPRPEPDQSYCSGGLSLKCQAPEPDMYEKWSIAPSNFSATKSPQAGSLYPVTEEDCTGLANIGFGGPRITVAMQRSTSKELLSSKLQQQERHNNRMSDASGCCSPSTWGASPPQMAPWKAGGLGREEAALNRCSSSSIDKLGLDGGRATAAATAHDVRSPTPASYDAADAAHAGRGSRRSSGERVEVGLGVHRDSTLSEALRDDGERRESTESSTSESSQLIKHNLYSNNDW